MVEIRVMDMVTDMGMDILRTKTRSIKFDLRDGSGK